MFSFLKIYPLRPFVFRPKNLYFFFFLLFLSLEEKKKTLLSPDLASPLAPPVMPAISRAQCSASIQRKPVLLFLSILEGHRESPGQRLTKPRVEPLQLRTIAARKKKPEFCSCTSAQLRKEKKNINVNRYINLVS